MQPLMLSGMAPPWGWRAPFRYVRSYRLLWNTVFLGARLFLAGLSRHRAALHMGACHVSHRWRYEYSFVKVLGAISCLCAYELAHARPLFPVGRLC